jgi:hypothetical protein
LLLLFRYRDLGSGGESTAELALVGMQGDLTGAFKLGRFILDLDVPNLNGMYSFGWILSLVGDVEHGAELIRSTYLPWAFTAQSVAAPFSYAIDFGLPGVVAMGALNGLLLGLVWRSLRTSSSAASLFAYLILFVNLLWSVRSGVPILSGPVVFQLLFIWVALVPARRGFGGHLLGIGTIVLLGSLLAASGALLLRF